MGFPAAASCGDLDKIAIAIADEVFQEATCIDAFGKSINFGLGVALVLGAHVFGRNGKIAKRTASNAPCVLAAGISSIVRIMVFGASWSGEPASGMVAA